MRLQIFALTFLLAAPLLAETPVTGKAVPALASFDELMIKFLADHEAPGASISVAKDGRTVYSRGFGYADKEKQTPVDPDALFRIASISKPITGAAILLLVQQGKLKLTDKAFDIVKVEPFLEGDAKPDPRLKEITILQLLQHTGGFDRDVSFDPMFRAIDIAKKLKTVPPAGPDEVIRYVAGRKLDHNPGERYAYSNVGYCVLGRVIEKVSGQSYEAYVKEHVLKPAGVTRMRMGRTLLEGRAEGEVKYYDRAKAAGRTVFGADGADGKRATVPQPYGAWYVEAMDAHGGWLASAPDLLKFGFLFDLPKGHGSKAVLNAESMATAFAAPHPAVKNASKDVTADGKPVVYYGCGWSVRTVAAGKINTWHTGGLMGTSTILVRRHDGLSWAVLFNSDFTAGPKGDWLASKLDPLMHQAAAKVREWPKP